MAEDGEVRVKITGDSEPIKKEMSKTRTSINKELISALNKLSSQLTMVAEQLQRVCNKSQGAFEPIIEDAPQTVQAAKNIGQALNNTSESAANAQKGIDGLSEGLKKTEEEADKFRDKTEGLGDKTEGLGDKSDKTKSKIGGLGDAAEKSTNKFNGLGIVLKSIGASMITAAGAAVAAAAKLGKEIVSSFADYEQLVGGVDTLFKESSAKIQEFADNAYKTAGMSANEYMETVTGFSASLISSLGGDTAKAAEYANMAVTDMSDNANKMGSDIESIQNAYQGFAKQNYTMLDNLKLGYGGTKEEMERLLADAEKISGIKYDVSSYADIVSAIHVIQESMDIAGTTAAEAEHTISGSIGTLKSAIKNLATGFGNAEADIEQLCQNVADAFTNVVDNITPVIENIIATLPVAVDALLSAVAEMLPTMIQAAADLFSQMLSAILELLPELIPAAVDAVILIANTIIENAPLLTNSAVQLITELVSGLGENADKLIPAAVDAILSIAQGLLDNVDLLLDSAEKLIIGINKGLIDSIPKLLEAVPDIIFSLGEALVDVAITSWVDLPARMLTNVIDGIKNFDFKQACADWADNCVEAFDKAVDDYADMFSEIGDRVTGYVTGGHSHGGGGTGGRREGSVSADEKQSAAYESAKKYALEMAAQYKAQSDEALKNAQKSADDIVELENKVSDEFKDAYNDLNMQQVYGEISEEEYYTKLEELLNSFHARGLSAYNKYYTEINSYRKKQNDKEVKEQEKADKESLKAKEKADKAALKELTKAQKESIAEVKKSLTELAKTYQKKYDEITKQQEAYAKKLKSGLDIFQKKETDDKIIYSISNIKEYKKQVEDFTKTVQKLKDRGLNKDMLSEIMDMDISEGLMYGKNILAMSDSEFNDINDTYNDLAALIDMKSQELYSGELQTVNDNFVSDVKSLFGTLPSEIQNIGLETAAGFVQGLDSSKATVISDTSDYFEDIFDSITDNIDSASAAVDTVGEYVDTFKTELESRSSEIYDAISKLFADTDAAAVIKNVVENENAAVSASVSGKAKSDSGTNTSSGDSKGFGDLIDALNKPIYITLDGQTIAEYVISYTNNKARGTGGMVIK